MKLLRRNTTEFEYLPWSGTETDVNSDGEHTGEFHPEYGDPITYRGNISSPSGLLNQLFYGMDVRFTHTLVMDTHDVEIRENGRVRWKGEMYEVRAVRPSLNGLSVALRKLPPDDQETEADTAETEKTPSESEEQPLTEGEEP